MEDKPEVKLQNSTVTINIEEEKNDLLKIVNEKSEKPEDCPKECNDTTVNIKGTIKIKRSNEGLAYAAENPKFVYGYGQQQQVYYAHEQGTRQGRQDASRTSPYRDRNADDDILGYRDRNTDSTFGSTFDDIAVRHRFIRKVYTLLTLQLALSLGIILMCMYVIPIKHFVRKNWIVAIVVGAIGTILYTAIIFYKTLRRMVPLNFILMTLLTLFMSYGAAFICTRYPNIIVFTAIGITAVVCLAISIIAIQTKCDITKWYMYLFIAGVVLFVFGIIAFIVTYFTGVKIVFIVYAALGAILMSFYLMFDTQTIIGGRRIEISPEEYILGAVQLYVDIIMMLQYLIQFIGLISDT